MLGLVLVLALLILLLPVKYKISAEKEKGGTLNADFRLTYFFRILRATAHYDKELIVKVKVLWFSLFEFKFPQEKSEDESKGMFDFDDEEFDEFAAEEIVEDNSTENSDTEESVNETSAEEETYENDEPGVDETDSVDSGENEDSKSDYQAENIEDEDPENDFEERDDLISKLKYKVEEICDKIEKVRTEYRYYHNVINSNEAAYALRNLKKRLFRILKKIFPRRLHAEIVYGFDSPDITGKVYGLYCIFRNRFDKSSHVTPDFDKAVFEGVIFAKGHFNLWCIVFNLLCIVLHPGSIKIYRSVKRHKAKKAEQETSGKEEAA